MDEQEYYRQLVSDAEVINTLLKEGQARESGVVAEKPRARPNLNFIQRTITNMVSSNQRKISEQVKRIETEKKKNKDYIARKPREIYYKQKKEKWTDEEILAHKKAMLACRISFIRAVEGIPAPEKTGIFEKPSLSKVCELKKKVNSERKSRKSGVEFKKTSSEGSSPTIIICDQSDEEKSGVSPTEKLVGETKKYRPSTSPNSNSSSSNDIDLKDSIHSQNRKEKYHRRKKRCSRSSTFSSSTSNSDRRYSRSVSASSCSSVDISRDKGETYYKRSSSSSSDSSYHNKTSKQIKRPCCSNSRSSSTSSSVICIQESDSESYTPSKYTRGCNKNLFNVDLKNKSKYGDKKHKKCSRKKRKKRYRSSSSSTDDVVCVTDTLKNETNYVDKKRKICSKKKKRKKHRTSSSILDDEVCVTDSHIVSIVITDSDPEGDGSYTPEYKSKSKEL
nr:unnamed protein product [Callosobruchus chinensis]